MIAIFAGCQQERGDAPTTWKTYRMPEASIQVAFPHAPDRDSTVIPTRLGDLVNYKVSAKSANAGFTVSWLTRPDSVVSPDSLRTVGWRRLYGARQSIVSQPGQRVLYEDTIECIGYLGYEIATKVESNGEVAVLLIRLFYVWPKFYQLTMATSDTQRSNDEMLAFFGRFRIGDLSMPTVPERAWEELKQHGKSSIALPLR